MSFRQRKLELIMVVMLFCITISCATVKPYQRRYLNDREMQLTKSSAGQFEDYYQSIREGSTPPESGKTNDGCGCK